jgi:F-type H+-transporting ATPase subunit b
MIYWLILFPTIAFAAGDGHGSPLDLIPPFINFILLFGFIIYKIKKPLGDFFVKKSHGIEETLKRAELKSHESKSLFELASKRLSSLPSEMSKLEAEVESETNQIIKGLKAEAEETKKKQETDLQRRIEAERNQKIKLLELNFLNEAMASVKSKLKNNSQMRSEISKNLSQGM